MSRSRIPKDSLTAIHQRYEDACHAIYMEQQNKLRPLGPSYSQKPAAMHETYCRFGNQKVIIQRGVSSINVAEAEDKEQRPPSRGASPLDRRSPSSPLQLKL
ncbi:PREDICTED: uncharacterized protein LOC106809776 [Priapulus caudatus]|uniref:Uncharacterized protein LOC106809776 n=1 Tax=Priapulus caudatus TaxID=37621 RepID=A0ABM1E8E6_PRICU|nr:PREDICTED: uncharacterized protein LOC106809776 [Priapulus caudatus]